MPPRFICVLVLIAMLLPCAAFARRKDESLTHGEVTLSDGSVPDLLVSVERVCKGVIQTSVFTDSEGRFTLPASESEGCQVRPYLPGYQSQSVPEKPDLATFVLKPIGKNDFALRKERNKPVAGNKVAWKAFHKGLDDAAKGKWRAAENSFHDAIVLAPWSGSPFLCLGLTQEREGDVVAAKKLYKDGIRTEDNFVLLFAYAAAIEIARGDWQEAFDDSTKVIQMEPQSFPGAWFANSWANLNLHRTEDAEKSAIEGLKLDTEHRFPELEYILGLIQLDRRDPAGAKEHFRKYLSLDPQGPRAAAARAEIDKQ